MHSQNDEELVILNYFARQQPGRFLDVGSHDGRTLSNTRALAEAGWCGVLIEPCPSIFAALLDLYGDNADMLLINAAVAETAGLATFHESYGDMVGSLDPAHAAKWSALVKFRPYLLSTITPKMLLEHVGYKFDFINIDVEGQSADLFDSLVAAGASARCWCVEHDYRADDIALTGTALGLTELSRNGENIILGNVT